MSRRALAMVFVLALSAWLLATWPLRLAVGAGPGVDLHALGLSAADASGSIWSGQLRSVERGGRPLGDVAVALDPLALLTGVLDLRLEAPEWSADVLSGRRRGIDNANGQLQWAMHAPLPGAVVRLSLADVDLLFADGACSRAGGTVQAEVAGIGPPLRLSGPVRCEGDNGTVTLAAAPGPGVPQVEVNLAIDGEGRFRLHSLVQPVDDVSALALRSAGFEPTPMGLSRTDGGRLY